MITCYLWRYLSGALYARIKQKHYIHLTSLFHIFCKLLRASSLQITDAANKSWETGFNFTE